MDFAGMHFNKLDDPPCPDGDDLGLGGAQPILAPGSDGLALPQALTTIAVRVPKGGVVARPCNPGGSPVSRISLKEGDYHVMVTPMGGGMQFNLEHALLDPSNPETHGSYETIDPDKLVNDISQDPRSILLRHFWSEHGCTVEPFAIRRTGLVAVRGRFLMVKVGNRWFHNGDVHAQLGRTTIVEQGERLRFLHPWEMRIEFTSVNQSNGDKIDL